MDLLFNPHPPLTGGPPTLVTCALLLEVLSLAYRKLAFHDFSRKLFLLACVIAPLTYFSGYFGQDAAQSVLNNTDLSSEIAAHQFMAKMFLLSLFPTFVMIFLEDAAIEKKQLIRSLYVVFLLISFTLVVLTADRGGDLVFEDAAGVAVPAH